MGFLDVVFFPSRDTFCTTFLKNCGGGKDNETVPCLNTVYGNEQDHVP